MMKRAGFVILMAFTIGAASMSAQEVALVVSGFGGFSGVEGIKGKDFQAANGEIYNQASPKKSGHYGASFGVVGGNGEYGFMFRRQMSQLTVSGPTATTLLGDMNIDNYHGYLAYYFGDPDKKWHPYALVGAGATNFGRVDFTMVTGGTATLAGRTEFTATFGAGLRAMFNRAWGLRVGVLWTPIYLTEDFDAVWCDTNSCHNFGYPQYVNQVEVSAGLVYRFGGR